METKEITISENYERVLRHRLDNSEVPNYKQLHRLALAGATKRELRYYIAKAKKAYESLLHVKNTA